MSQGTSKIKKQTTGHMKLTKVPKIPRTSEVKVLIEEKDLMDDWRKAFVSQSDKSPSDNRI